MSRITSYSTNYQTFPALFELEPVAGILPRQSRKAIPGGGRTSGAAERQRDVADIEAAETPGGGLPSRHAPERGCHEVTGVEKARLRSKRRGSGICPVNIVPRAGALLLLIIK